MIKNTGLYYNELERSANVDWIPWERLNNAKILITGASGMIGSYLVDLLMVKNQIQNTDIVVYALGRNEEKLNRRFERWNTGTSNLRIICEDVLTMDVNNHLIKEVDYIIHAASTTHPHEYATKPVDTIKTNVIGLMNLLDSQVDRSEKAKIVMLSSVEIYGEAINEMQDFSEKDMGYIDSNSLRAGYPESKRVCEAMLQAYRSEYRIPSVIARLSRVYGPGVEDDDTKAMTQFIMDAVNKKDIVLKSEGNQVFSYCYVADASLAVIKIMLDGEEGEAYNVISPDSKYSLKKIAGLLADEAGTKVVYKELSGLEQRGVSRATHATLIDKKYREIGGKGEYSLKQGLKDTIMMMKDAGKNH